MQRVKRLGGLPKCVEEPEGVFGRAKMTTAAMETGVKGRPGGVVISARTLLHTSLTPAPQFLN